MTFKSTIKKLLKSSSTDRVDYLKVLQTEDELIFKGQLNKKERLTNQLWLIDRDSQKEFLIKEIIPDNKFEFNVSLIELSNELYEEYENEELTLDWYINVLTEKENIESEEKKVRLGRFNKTYIDSLEAYTSNRSQLNNYITKKGSLSLTYNRKPKHSVKLQIEKLTANKKHFFISGKLFSRHSKVLSSNLLLKSRNEGNTLKYDLNLSLLEEETSRKFGLNRYLYNAKIALQSEDGTFHLTDDIYDVYLVLKLHNSDDEVLVRVGKPTLTTKFFSKDLTITNKHRAQIIRPYYTFKQGNLSFELFEYPIDVFNYLKKAMRWSWVIKLLNTKKHVWLVGERSYKAQDTGYHFFKYIRQKYPEKEVYYVIDENSPEKRNVEPLGNVLHFGSKEHIFYTLISKKVISSHHPDYLYPIRSSKFIRKVKADKVFLQHGVMGTKNMVANYGKNAPGFDTDLFLVSSDFEKDMIVNDFGYNENEVKVTGLSRFDALLSDINSPSCSNQILIIPTWRDWIYSKDAFENSEYYHRYKELVNHPELQRIVQTHNLEILFCLHPNMQPYIDYFKDSNVTIIRQGDVDVQQLIKTCKLMITDYSSVAFDFSFLYKPVIYYQFDRRRFIGKKGSHLKLDQDLPGDIVFDVNELINQLSEYVNDDFKMKEENKKRTAKFLKYRDTNSSDRIYHVISEFQKPKKSLFLSIKHHYLYKGLYKKFRKSSYYYPLMKSMYKFYKVVLPKNNKLILFESGLGKQYGDSPRNIYEELLKRNTDYQFIWVHNKKTISGKNTKTIKRLTPMYFYYLARAGFWVNNQNFPSYIKKPRSTKFLQTWHGTPLKKMLHDIEEIKGRDSGYLARVSEAITNWDYLISPSHFATKAFESAFEYKGKVLEVGYPRNDIFYTNHTESLKNSVYDEYSIPKHKKIILYAPTFRDNQKKNNKFSFDLNLDLELLNQRLGDEYVLLLRMHVLISNLLEIPEELSEFVIDVSKYGEIQELLVATDILITDYSSIMFDFANTKKPMLFYTYDFEEYQNKLRGFYIDFANSAPGPLLDNSVEIINTIENIEEVKTKYKEKYDTFYKEYCYLEDGRASKRVVDTIF